MADNWDTWTTGQVVEALAARGYSSRQSTSRETNEIQYFVSPESSSAVTQVLTARFLPKWSAYEFGFGFKCLRAHKRLQPLESLIEDLNKAPRMNVARVLWTSFPAGHVLGLGADILPDPTRRDASSDRFRRLCSELLEPILEATTTCEQVLNVLLKSEKPFAWTVNPVLRAAEVIAIGAELGKDMEPLKSNLLDLSPALIQPFRSSRRWQHAVQQLIGLILD
jgi:hypothetical protein